MTAPAHIAKCKVRLRFEGEYVRSIDGNATLLRLAANAFVVDHIAATVSVGAIRSAAMSAEDVMEDASPRLMGARTPGYLLPSGAAASLCEPGTTLVPLDGSRDSVEDTT